jgi:hypothetical protein
VEWAQARLDQHLVDPLRDRGTAVLLEALKHASANAESCSDPMLRSRQRGRGFRSWFDQRRIAPEILHAKGRGPRNRRPDRNSWSAFRLVYTSVPATLSANEREASVRRQIERTLDAGSIDRRLLLRFRIPHPRKAPSRSVRSRTSRARRLRRRAPNAGRSTVRRPCSSTTWLAPGSTRA